jgi:mTERF domain-containing protein
MRASAGRSGRVEGSERLRVPSSKELQKMRQFRQTQLFRQQQQMRQRIVSPTGAPGLPKKEEKKGSTGTAGSIKGGDPEKHSAKGRGADGSVASMAPGDGIGQQKLKGGPRKNKAALVVEDGLTKVEFLAFAEKHDFEQSWRAQIHILKTLGLTTSQLVKLSKVRREIFQTSSKTLTRKIAFFRDTLMMSDAEIVKLVTKSPRVLEYGSEQTVRPRIQFLESQCGVPSQVISKVVLKAPMIMSLGMKETLEPRVAFLKKSLGLNKSHMGKLVSRHPQVLTCTEDMMQQRVDFLTNRAGVRPEDLSKVVVAHPQVLHYKLNSMQERLEYLSSVGMSEEDISQAVSRFPQIFSLSVTTNMAPKWHYLVEHLGGDVKALRSYPGYFSLSLNNRIMMRHLYLDHMLDSGAPLPFPLSYLKVSDEKFATEIASSTMEDYEAFKKSSEAQGKSSEASMDQYESSDENDLASGMDLLPKQTSNVQLKMRRNPPMKNLVPIIE